MRNIIKSPTLALVVSMSMIASLGVTPVAGQGTATEDVETLDCNTISAAILEAAAGLTLQGLPTDGERFAQDAYARCSEIGYATLRTTPIDEIGERVDALLEGVDGDCYGGDYLWNGPGESIVCFIACGWRIESANYRVRVTAISDGTTGDAPTVYAGVGCSNQGFYHTIPLGTACGAVDGHCNQQYGDGIELQWGTCVFAAGGEGRIDFTETSCSWER